MNKLVGIALFSLLTGMSTAQTVIYNEDFESGAPVAFTIIDNDGLTPAMAVSEFTEAWIRLADPDNPTDTVMGSTSFFSPTGTADRWLISPAIALGGYGNVLSWEARSHDPSFPDDYMVVVSSTDTQLASFIDTVGSVIQENATWTNRSVNLSEYGLDNQTVHVAFINKTNNGFKLYIDDINMLIEDTLSVQDLYSTLNVQVYPNPTSSVISVDREDIISLAVIGTDGKELLSGVKTNTLNVEFISNGRYLLRVLTEMGITFVPFVKI